MKKTVVKKTKKTQVKPEIMMDCTKINTLTDVYNEYINAKVRANKPLTKEELEFAKDTAAYKAADMVSDILCMYSKMLPTLCTKENTFEVKKGEKLVFDEYGNAKIKKPNIFRRFWNWITRK